MGEETRAMRTSFSVNDMTIHRIVEQESGFTPMLDFLPTLSKETLAENLAWLAPGGYDSASGNFVMCTHLHGDHVGWNTRLENGRWVPTFPKARYLFSKKEYTYWSEIHKKTPLDQISDSVLPII